MEAVRLNKAAAELAEQMLRHRLVLSVVARVQVRNSHTRVSELDSLAGSSKLGEVVAQMPGELTRWPDGLVVVSILRDRCTSPLPFRIHAERLAVHPIRFGEQYVVLGDAELIRYPGVCEIPRVGLRARRNGEVGHVGDEPLRGGIGPEAASGGWAVEDGTEICPCAAAPSDAEARSLTSMRPGSEFALGVSAMAIPFNFG